jgi:PhnB protein
MSTDVNYIAEGFHSVTPYLIIKGAAKAIEFYQDVFGAVEETRMEMPGGAVGHAELRIGDSKIMLADEFPDLGHLSPESVGGTAVGICLYLPDADAVFEKAVAAGAKVLKPMADQFYGDRSGTFLDPWGHQWTAGTHTEDLTDEQLRERMAAMMKEGHGCNPESE